MINVTASSVLFNKCTTSHDRFQLVLNKQILAFSGDPTSHLVPNNTGNAILTTHNANLKKGNNLSGNYNIYCVEGISKKASLLVENYSQMPPWCGSGGITGSK